MVRSKYNNPIRQEVRSLEEQLEQLSTAVDELVTNSTNTKPSPGRILIEQAIQVCESFLETMVNEIRLKHHLNEAQQRKKCLNDQLEVYLGLLSQIHDSNPGAEKNSQETSTDEVRLLDSTYKTIEKIAKSNTDDAKLPIQVKDLFNSDQQESLFSSGRIIQSKINDKTEQSLVSNKNKCVDKKASMEIHILGEFKVYIDSNYIDNWPKGKGKQLFKYLVTNRKSPVAKEVLMDMFWPEYDADSARNNLNVAVYSLRKVFRKYLSGVSHVVFKEGCYMFNPEIDFWVDSEEFDEHLKKAEKFDLQGDVSLSIENYKQAEGLYQGDYLKDDLYLDWAFEVRECYKEKHINILNKLDDYYYQENDLATCIQLNKNIITADTCNEQAHQRLMNCYTVLGQRHLALRQYQTCAKSLKKELDLEPCQKINELFHHIKELESV